MSRAHRDARRGDGSSRYSPAQLRAKDTLEVLEFAGRLLAEAPTNLFAPLIDGAWRFLAQRVSIRQHLSSERVPAPGRPGRGFRNQIGASGVAIDGLATKRGIAMPRPQLDNDTLAPTLVPSHSHTRYLVVRHRGEWFIKFHGEAYGPYNTEREAMRFAIDAAYKLGESGEESQVLSMDESGNIQSTWTRGQHPFPSWQ
jgi:hypothetical protein